MPTPTARALILHLAALLGLGMIMAACGSRAPASLKPAVAIEGTQQVEMLAVTNRRRVDDLSQLFGGERRLRASYARLTVSLPPRRQPGEVIWADASPADPARTFATTRADLIERPAFQAALRQIGQRTGRGQSGPSRGGRQVLLFVHGYNTRFDEAAFRLAQITADTGTVGEVLPILFSWPSWGSVAAYPYDRESAAISRDALAELIEQLAADPTIRHMTVLAHSMGGFVTLEALRTVALRNRRLPPKIADVMLAAPDVDVDIAAEIGRSLGTPRPRMTLFTSRDDRALGFSRFAWGSRDRLGSIDPTQEPYRRRLAEAGVQVIDLSGDTTLDRLNHGRFADSPRAVQAIGARLAAGNALDAGTGNAGDQIATIAQGAARTIGTVVTTPLRVLSDTPEPSGTPTE